MTSEEGLRIAKEIVQQRTKAHKAFENIIQDILIISGGDGNITCEFEVKDEHRNSHGTLHGGMMSLLVDSVTTWGLHTKLRDKNSVSLELSMRFIKPPRVGEKIIIQSKTVKCGRRVAFLSADIRSKDGSLLAHGNHTKLIIELNSKL